MKVKQVCLRYAEITEALAIKCMEKAKRLYAMRLQCKRFTNKPTPRNAEWRNPSQQGTAPSQSVTLQQTNE